LLSASVLGFSSRIFESLGFEITNIVGSVADTSLNPPDIDPNSPAGRVTRSKLLRGWVELSAWAADFSKRFGRICG
jgi:ubiquitin carboxyl-terminal hydrolase 25/28